jgi:hypothetical protein
VGQTFLFVLPVRSDRNARLPIENVLWRAGLTDLKRDIFEIAVPTVILPRTVCEICFDGIVQHVV